MVLYYLQSEFVQGKHRIVWALSDEIAQDVDTSVLSPFNTLEVDESNGNNKTLRNDIIKTIDQNDLSRESKYYIDGSGAIKEKEDWVKHEVIF